VAEANATDVQLDELKNLNDGLALQARSSEQARLDASRAQEAAEAEAAVMRRALSESKHDGERFPNEAELQAQHARDLAAQHALASQHLADVVARESAKRREEHESLVRLARQEHDSIVCSLRAELVAVAGELGQARESYDRLVADWRSELVANAATAGPHLADMLAQESTRRHEEHDVLIRLARQEHDSIVGALRTELSSVIGELGQTRASYDRLVGDRRSEMEANATTTDPKLLVEVLVLRERMTQATIEKKELQVTYDLHIEAARVAHGQCREELILKNAQVMFVSADLDRSREAAAKSNRERELLTAQLLQQQRERGQGGQSSRCLLAARPSDAPNYGNDDSHPTSHGLCQGQPWRW
jgi:hypothetical protein